MAVNTADIDVFYSPVRPLSRTKERSENVRACRSQGSALTIRRVPLYCQHGVVFLILDDFRLPRPAERKGRQAEPENASMPLRTPTRGPRARKGKSRVGTGAGSAGEYEGRLLPQIVAILIALGLLSAVAIPRYFDARRDRQREAQEAEARGFIRVLHGVLSLNAADHYLKGTEWVKTGEELMGLLPAGADMPRGMRYSENLWTDGRTGLAWEFHEASDRLPPRIRRVGQGVPPEKWEIEPLDRGPETPPPE